MPLLNESQVRAKVLQRRRLSPVFESANTILTNQSKSFSKTQSYNVFLCHSINDAEIVLGVKYLLEDLGYKVYVDWINDQQLDRSSISASTAETLRERMKSSKSLFYITTENADKSRWMPWECGYFDGIREKVAIVPVKMLKGGIQFDSIFVGQEYLGLYPYVTYDQNTKPKPSLKIHKYHNAGIPYDAWVEIPNNKIPW